MNQYKLKDVAISQTGPFGSQLHEEDYVANGIPIVTVEHLGDIGFTTQNLPMVSEKDACRLKKYCLKKGDIVFSRVGSIDRNVYTKEDQEGWLFSGRCIRVRCDITKVNPRYLSFYFKLPSFKQMMFNRSVGATMPSLNTDIMDDLPLLLLNRNEQDKVSKILGGIDDKIENNNTIVAQLESLAKTIYDYWFVQFDFPDENGRPYKSSGGKMVWNERLQREIPDGWRVEQLRNLIVNERGISYNSSNIETGMGVPMINLASFNPGDGKYKASGLKYYQGKYPDKKKLKPYDLIMCNTQQTKINFYTDIIGRAMLVPDIYDGDVVFSHHVTVIRATDDYLKYYLLFLFNSDYFHKYISGYTYGTNILSLIFDGVNNYITEIPDAIVLKKFAHIILNVYRKKSEIIKENQQLASLRDFLLPLLMNGQVSFKSDST